MSGKSDVQAVKDAGYALSDKSAAAVAQRIRNKYTDANGSLLVSLESHGVNLDRVASAINVGLNATRTVKSGKQVKVVPDFHTRHKYLETTLDVMGARAPKQIITHEHKTHEETVAIVDGLRSNPEAVAFLVRRIEERKAQLTEVSGASRDDED